MLSDAPDGTTEEEGMAMAPMSPQMSRRSTKRACLDEDIDPVSDEVQEHLAKVLMHQFTVFEEKLERRQVMQNSVIIGEMKQQVALMVAGQDSNLSEIAASLHEL